MKYRADIHGLMVIPFSEKLKDDIKTVLSVPRSNLRDSG